MKKGFQKSKNKSIFYVLKNNGSIMILCIHVEELIFIGNNLHLLQEFKKEIMEAHEMIDLDLCIISWGLKFLKYLMESLSLKGNMPATLSKDLR